MRNQSGRLFPFHGSWCQSQLNLEELKCSTRITEARIIILFSDVFCILWGIKWPPIKDPRSRNVLVLIYFISFNLRNSLEGSRSGPLQRNSENREICHIRILETEIFPLLSLQIAYTKVNSLARYKIF